MKQARRAASQTPNQSAASKAANAVIRHWTAVRLRKNAVKPLVPAVKRAVPAAVPKRLILVKKRNTS